MDVKTQKRFSFLVNIVYLAVFVALFYLFVKYALPLVAPFAIALVIAAILQRPSNFLHNKTKIPKGIIGVVLVLLIIGGLVGIIAVAGVQVSAKVKEFISFLTAQFNNLPGLVSEIQNSLLSMVSSLPDAVAEKLTDLIRGFSVSTIMKSLSAENIMDTLKTPISGAWDTVKQLPSLLISMLITVISACFLTKDYPIIREFIFRQFPQRSQKKVLRAKKLVFYSLGKIIKSYVLIILITATELSIGLGLLTLIGVYGSGYIIPISLLIAVIDIVPVLGTGTVLIPWAVISLISGSTGMGIGLIVIYAVISVVRQILEPKLVAGQFDLPAIVTIASMYIGTKIFGAIGLFLLPLTVIVLKLLADEGIIGFVKTKKSVEREKEREAGASEEELDARFEQELRAKPEGAAGSGSVGQKLEAFVAKAVSDRRRAQKENSENRKNQDGKENRETERGKHDK